MLARRWRYVSLIMLTLIGLAVISPAVSMPVAEAGEYAKEDPRSVPVKSLEDAIETGRIPKETVEAARRDGMAPVIIQLRLPEPFRAEGTLDRDRAELQRQAIDDTQSAVMEGLAGLKYQDEKAFETIPWIALWADTATLTKLVADPNVVRITIDRVEDFHLDTSVPQIFGDVVRQSLGTPGAGQVVAFLDTGIDGSHPYLAGKVVSEGCFSTGGFLSGSKSVCPNGRDTTVAGSGTPCSVDGCEHGTHLAGVATANDGSTYGVAPQAKIISIKVASDFGGYASSRASDQIQGLERVYELRNTFNIAAVNISAGGGYYTSAARCDDDNEHRKDIIDNLRSFGVATVASSGNRANPFQPGITAPACISSVISVGATMGNGASESIGIWNGASQTAPILDLLAPGTGIESSVPGNSTDSKDGTSMAAAFVTGSIAVMRGQDPLAPVGVILNALSTTGIPITDTRPTPNITTPRIRLDLALEAFTQRPLPVTDLNVEVDFGIWLEASWTNSSVSASSFILTATPPENSLLPVRHAPGSSSGGIVGIEVAADGSTLKLKPDTDYTLTVQACNAAGNCSESAPISHHTLDILPDEPENLHISNLSASGVTLNWHTDYPATFVRLAYYICGLGHDCDHTRPAFEIHGDESLEIGGLVGNWLLRWRVQACSVDGCSAWVDGPAVETPSPGTAPAAPSDLHLCGTSGDPFELCLADRITLGWTDNAGNEDRYEFEWSAAQPGTPPWNGTWNTVTLGSNVRGYSLTSWTSGLLYYFRVRACNIYGCSSWSNMVTYTAP